MEKTYKFTLKTGVDKNGKNWYGLVVSISKFVSAQLFISQIEYDYLTEIQRTLK